MKIDRHISALLYEHDCVIVPELGGFVCNYSPAKIHPLQHSFSPPSKTITFNSSLKNNDGLLANHISFAEKKSYGEANNIIRSFVVKSNEELRGGKKVLIEEVGALFLDKEKNIQFDPDDSVNYLSASFGLGNFRSLPVKREGVSKRIEKEFKDRVIIPSKDKDKRKKIIRRRIVVTAILLPFVLASVWVSINFNEVRKGNYSSLNPFAKKHEALYKPATGAIPLINAKDFAVKAEIGPTIQLNDDTKRTIVVKENVTLPDATYVKNSSSVQVTSVTSGTYYIVGGCFEVFDNAINFSKMMKSKGYEGIILEKGLGRLSPVCYSSYKNKADAVKALEQIHSSTDPNAWLMAR